MYIARDEYNIVRKITQTSGCEYWSYFLTKGIISLSLLIIL